MWSSVLGLVFWLDLAAVIMLLLAGKTAFLVLLAWDPDQMNAMQLRLEREVPRMILWSRSAQVALLFASTAWVAMVTQVLPQQISGAMCGTGVLQAMGDLGWRCLGLRGAAISVGYLFWARAGVHLKDNLGPFSLPLARLCLVFGLLTVMNVWSAWLCVISFEDDVVVNCCAVVFDPIHVEGLRAWLAGMPDACWFWAPLALSGILIPLGLWHGTGRLSAFRFRFLPWATMGWCVVALGSLVFLLASYVYEVLGHDCFWCLFDARHGYRGFILGALLSLAFWESWVAAVGVPAPEERDEVAEMSWRRCRAAGIRLALAVTGFCLVAYGPAVWWRLRFGLWLH